MAAQKISILGSTGSIGANTLDVIARHPERFTVFALTAHTRVDVLFEQCRRVHPRYARISRGDAPEGLARRLLAAGGGAGGLCAPPGPQRARGRRGGGSAVAG